MLETAKTLRKQKEFSIVFRSGRKQVGKLMVVYALKNGLGINRYGIIASKKVGNAVIRNRTKRRLRDFIRRNETNINSGFDLIFVARARINTAPFEEIITEGAELLKRVGLSVCLHDC